jgi:hypothetical protein
MKGAETMALLLAGDLTWRQWFYSLAVLLAPVALGVLLAKYFFVPAIQQAPDTQEHADD